MAHYFANFYFFFCLEIQCKFQAFLYFEQQYNENNLIGNNGDLELYPTLPPFSSSFLFYFISFLYCRYDPLLSYTSTILMLVFIFIILFLSRYDPLSSCLVDFKGRANIASVKNFQLIQSYVADPDPRKAQDIDADKDYILQVGKVGGEYFL